MKCDNNSVVHIADHSGVSKDQPKIELVIELVKFHLDGTPETIASHL